MGGMDIVMTIRINKNIGEGSVINGFQGPFRFLSNFYRVQVEMDGFLYPSVEHAYQAAKTLDVGSRTTIQLATKPGDAKRLGRRVKLRDDWESIKLDVMLGLLRDKFTYPVLRSWLLDTGESVLIEDNNWGDRFWGSVDGEGDNHLGRLLMRVREEIRTEQASQ